VKRRGILDIFGRMMYSNIYILSKSEIWKCLALGKDS
jgi:hypothetical protein